VRHITTKAQKREALDREMEKYLSKGGEVLQVEQGKSGLENPTQALLPVLFNEKTSTRTDARSALKKIDARKKKTKKPVHRPKQQKKKPVYDDFGEVLRWVWADE
jgi:hypothetical protein